MSFSPLPPTFLEVLRAARPGRAVEVGCGDGRFADVLAAAGSRPMGIDRRPPWTGSTARVVADARYLPLADGSIDLLVAANLLHHLWSRGDGEAVPPDWRRCLTARGWLFVFEDEPTSRPLAARNHRDLQTFLARLDARGRRPLLGSGEFRRRLARRPGRGRWSFGSQRNETTVTDTAALRAWLLGERQGAVGEARRLAAVIGEHGLAYGRYWWAAWTPETRP